MSDTQTRPQSFYDAIKRKYAEERDLRLAYRPKGRSEFITEFSGDLAKYEANPFEPDVPEREPIDDEVEVLFIGGGFSALLTAARMRETGLESIRIVERGGDVGGAWYWNRYPGVACDSVAYDYLPLLDEMDYVPVSHYSKGDEIFGHCQAIAKKYNLYEMAVFHTTVSSTVWNEEDELWHIGTDRGDHMRAKFVVCANGIACKPRLSKIQGMEDFAGHSFHTSRWDYDYTGDDLSKLRDKTVGIIGTGATAVQVIPELTKHAKELYVFQRTPSSIDIKDDWPTNPNWARKLKPGWQSKRREKALSEEFGSPEDRAKLAAVSREEKIRLQENDNIDHMMRIHRRIDKIVHDPEVADALKPWYMLRCKRPCFHNEYLPSFNHPNVHLVDTHGKGITRITDKGPVFEDREYPLDLLVYATGFEIQKTGIYNEIVGKGGLGLEEKYSDGIRTLLGVHSKGYPNMFVMAGYQAPFRFNLTDMLQIQGDHIAECVDFARKNGIRTMDVKEESEEWWVQEVIKFRGKTNFSEECTPGYYNFEGESTRRQDGIYNGGFRKYYDHLGEVRADMAKHFDLVKDD